MSGNPTYYLMKVVPATNEVRSSTLWKCSGCIQVVAYPNQAVPIPPQFICHMCGIAEWQQLYIQVKR